MDINTDVCKYNKLNYLAVETHFANFRSLAAVTEPPRYTHAHLMSGMYDTCCFSSCQDFPGHHKATCLLFQH